MYIYIYIYILAYIHLISMVRTLICLHYLYIIFKNTISILVKIITTYIK